MKHTLKRLFSGFQSAPPWWRIVLWWELRRIPYNCFVSILAAGWLLLFTPDKYVVEPTLIVVLIVLNVLYTGLWVFETVCRLVDEKTPLDAGPTMFAAQLAFTVFLFILIVHPLS